MTSSRIQGRLLAKLLTQSQLDNLEFKVEDMEKELEEKLEMIAIQVLEMDTASQKDAAIVLQRI